MIIFYQRYMILYISLSLTQRYLSTLTETLTLTESQQELIHSHWQSYMMVAEVWQQKAFNSNIERFACIVVTCLLQGLML